MKECFDYLLEEVVLMGLPWLGVHSLWSQPLVFSSDSRDIGGQEKKDFRFWLMR